MLSRPLTLAASLVIALAAGCGPADTAAPFIQDVTATSRASASEVTSDSGQEDGTAVSGKTCARSGHGLVEELSGVRRRAGECLVSYDGRPSADADSYPTPEGAIVAAGFGRYTVTADPDAGGAAALLRYAERDGGVLVGSYGVQEMGDGGFLVHSVIASTPIQTTPGG